MSTARTRKPRASRLQAVPSIWSALEYGARIAEADAAPGDRYWRTITVRHLPPEENQGRHNVYVDALDEKGRRAHDADLRIGFTWEGRRPDEPAEPGMLDKPEAEPAGNVTLHRGQRLVVWIEGDGLPSDRAENLHSNHKDELAVNGESWNSAGHHSFHVVFQRTEKTPQFAEAAAHVMALPASSFRFEAWPTERRFVNQWFGVNREIYSKFGFPGHEGIDIAAPTGSKIFCVAPGQVKRVQATEDGNNYGIHVRVQHADGYETIYAHLLQALVTVGSTVAAGQVLGLADSTGNSKGSHLHLTLKHAGETLPGYRNNIVDPTPFLKTLLDQGLDGARYVSDVIPDGTRFEPQQAFEQRWTLRNSGSSLWRDGYALAYLSGDRLATVDAVPAPPTDPDGTAEVQVSFRAPSTPGRYRSVWQMRNPAGVRFGERIWVEIVVPQMVSAALGKMRIREKLGIDANAPFTDSRTISPLLANPGLIADTGVGWARLNFVLGPWTGIDDETRHEGRTWKEAYAEILRNLHAQGLRVYGLIGAQAVREDPENRFRTGPGQATSDEWIRKYAETFGAITRMFHDQVEVFESFNEPDDWHQSDRNWVHPDWYAIMLQAVHDRVRSDPEIRDIRLVSGPLQGLDINQNAGARYLRDAYAAGKRFFDWGGAAPFPFDGIGYHLYVAQDTATTTVDDVRKQYRDYMAELRDVIRKAEKADRPIYISEIGWQSTNGEDKQMERLNAGLGALLNDPSVALGIWFCTQDWSEKWGLYPEGDPAPDRRKLAFTALNKLCARTETVPTVMLTPVVEEAIAPAAAFGMPEAVGAIGEPTPIEREKAAAGMATGDQIAGLVAALGEIELADATTIIRALPLLAGLDVILRGYSVQLAAVDGSTPAGPQARAITQHALDQILMLTERLEA